MILSILHIRTDPDADRESSSSLSGERTKVTQIEFTGFERNLLVARRPWAGVAGSLMMHCALGYMAWTVSDFLRTIEREKSLEARLQEATSVYIQLRNVPLVWPRREQRNDESTPLRVDDRSKEGAPSINRGQKGAGLAARRFELPPIRRRPESEQTLLQPAFAPDVTPKQNVRLPEFVVWSAEMPKIEPPPLRKFVIPGRKTPVIQQPSLTEIPSLSLPATEQTNSGLTTLALVNSSAKLKLPPGPAAPIRTFQPPPQRPAATVSMDVLPGDPSAVVALNPNPAAMNPLVVVPGGNQIGRLPPPRGDAGAVTARTGAGGTSGSGTSGGGAADAACCGGNPGSGPNGGGKGGRGTDPTMPAQSASGSGAGAVIGAIPPIAGPPVRLTHPDNGVSMS